MTSLRASLRDRKGEEGRVKRGPRRPASSLARTNKKPPDFSGGFGVGDTRFELVTSSV